MSEDRWTGQGKSNAADVLSAALERGADKAVVAGLSGWWARRSETEKTATALIAFAITIGPLGMGLLAAAGALFNSEVPNGRQVAAVFWLFLIAAPLAAFCLVFVSTAGKHAAVPVALGLAAVAAVLVSGGLTNSPIPSELAGLYCYAGLGGGEIVYEAQCRKFDNAGFVAANRGRTSPSGGALVFASAVAYTADARGSIMAAAAILASIGVGLLIRENN